ncbi:hypothetical protein B0H10DRAFT_1950317 [Mycena sp. CBHHK59/15]|nr:hypothetical protein B0H10DRAFT_1950317 [Mycena sp. CBHHK59/15]
MDVTLVGGGAVRNPWGMRRCKVRTLLKAAQLNFGPDRIGGVWDLGRGGEARQDEGCRHAHGANNLGRHDSGDGHARIRLPFPGAKSQLCSRHPCPDLTTHGPTRHDRPNAPCRWFRAVSVPSALERQRARSINSPVAPRSTPVGGNKAVDSAHPRISLPNSPTPHCRPARSGPTLRDDESHFRRLRRMFTSFALRTAPSLRGLRARLCFAPRIERIAAIVAMLGGVAGLNLMGNARTESDARLLLSAAGQQRHEWSRMWTREVEGLRWAHGAQSNPRVARGAASAASGFVTPSSFSFASIALYH